METSSHPVYSRAGRMLMDLQSNDVKPFVGSY